MTLLLRATTLNDEPISLPLVGRFDERGGTLGRSDEATLTLPDPERLISRVQAQIVHRDDAYWIENLSLVSPLLHNGRALSNGMRVVLHEGDEIRIAGYALEVAYEDDRENATLLAGRTLVPRVPQRPAAGRKSPPPVRELASGRESGSYLREPPPPARESVPTLSGASGPASAESLWESFLAGAELEGSLPVGPTPEMFHAIGQMLKISVDGLQRLIAMRAQAKNEMQAEMTMIQARDNNPLKFSPDAELALQMLLQPKARGFLGGARALRDAIADLQSHQVGMTAGMRSVVNAVLERLDPAKFAAVPMQRSALDFLKPGQREARLWELYVKEYGALREEAQGGLQRLVGDALREAYEAQVKNLGTTFDEPDAPDEDWHADELEPRNRPRR